MNFHPLVLIGFVTFITTIGDVFLKMAGKSSKFIDYRWFSAGIFVYIISGILFFFTYRNLKLSSAGPLYGILTTLLFTFYTVFIFKETLTQGEIIGIALAIASMVMLSRFS